jgi:hypothetical protein
MPIGGPEGDRTTFDESVTAFPRVRFDLEPEPLVTIEGG